ncbi:MAG TPA: hypothetical protein VEP90_05510 [Methylomirabilota bacterium]|nr:hypothetical protein [Methylomirabilota bacterium]
MITPQDKQDILEVISKIPDLGDRVYLMVMMENYPMEVAEIVHEALRPLKRAGLK